MPTILGYARPGSTALSMQEQIDRLTASGASKIFQEQTTNPRQNRLQLNRLIASVSAGDTVVVTGLDRIARNTRHLLDLFETFSTAGASLKVLDCGIDTSTPNGELLRMLLGVITDFERQMLRESQAEGIAKAKREGRYKGRKPTARAKTDEVLSLSAQGVTRQKIADELGIGVASVYRILKNNKLKPKVSTKKVSQKLEKKPVEKPKRAERKKKPESSAEQLSFF